MQNWTGLSSTQTLALHSQLGAVPMYAPHCHFAHDYIEFVTLLN